MNEERSSNDRDEPNIESTKDPDQSVVQSEWPEFENPSTAVVEAVAAATNSDPLDLTPLYDALDTDALDSLISAVENDLEKEVRVSFPYEDFIVLVEGNGALTVSVDSTGDE